MFFFSHINISELPMHMMFTYLFFVSILRHFFLSFSNMKLFNWNDLIECCRPNEIIFNLLKPRFQFALHFFVFQPFLYFHRIVQLYYTWLWGFCGKNAIFVRSQKSFYTFRHLKCCINECVHFNHLKLNTKSINFVWLQSTFHFPHFQTN